MPRQAPYLQRRGHTLSFRIAVPGDLRALIGGRELSTALCITDKRIAVPVALECAAIAKRLFNELRMGMADSDANTLQELLIEAKGKMRRVQTHEQHEDEIDEIRRQHREELKRVKLEAANEALRSVLTVPQALRIPIPPLSPESPPEIPSKLSVVTLKTVIDSFLANYRRKNKPAMLKKHLAVLPMLLDIVGDKPIADILQSDINGFFELLDKLPPRWKDACRKTGLTIRQLIELDHEIAVGPKSFKDTYLASVRFFLKSAKVNWQDQKFPLGLTTEGIEYLGDREEGESKQRSFKAAELKRLFEGAEMQAYARDPAQAHRFWLPLIGLYTGARVNEICQLNPQTDILKDPETGVSYIWITKDTEADRRIIKSVKTGDSRKVPIHKNLIELGFLAYSERVRATGSKLIFPAWEPVNRRASGNAEKWFRQFLRNTGLRDETPKAMILGMHAFRHTLLTYGAMQKPALSLFCITGHAQEEAPIPASGSGKGYLTLDLLSPLNERGALLDQLDYALNFFKPAAS